MLPSRSLGGGRRFALGLHLPVSFGGPCPALLWHDGLRPLPLFRRLDDGDHLVQILPGRPRRGASVFKYLPRTGNCLCFSLVVIWAPTLSEGEGANTVRVRVNGSSPSIHYLSLSACPSSAFCGFLLRDHPYMGLVGEGRRLGFTSAAAPELFLECPAVKPGWPQKGVSVSSRHHPDGELFTHFSYV